MNAALLQLACGGNAFPCSGNLDQHAVNMRTSGFVQGNEAFRTRHGGGSVKGQTCVDFCRDTAWHYRENFAAKLHQQTVHHFIQRCIAPLAGGGLQQGLVLRLLHSLQNQGGVGGGILGLVLGDLLEIAGVSHHRGVLLKLFELVHAVSLALCVFIGVASVVCFRDYTVCNA